MYYEYPFSVVIIYYEALTEKIPINQIKRIRDTVHESNNCIVNRHTSISLIVNVPSNSDSKEMHIIPSKEDCISHVFCSRGYPADEIINLVIENRLNEIEEYIKKYNMKIKLLPIFIISIQHKNVDKCVNAQMFLDLQGNIKVINFTFSQTVTNKHKSGEGDINYLQEFLEDIFSQTITRTISDAIDRVNNKNCMPSQAFISLE